MKENLVNIFKNYGFYFWPALVLVVIFVVFTKIDLPQIRQINILRQQLVGIQERLSELTAKSNFLARLDEERLKEDFEKIILVLPDSKDAPSILRNLENSASSSGVYVEDLDLVPGKLATSTAVLGEKPNEIPVRMVIRGTIEQIAAFLEKNVQVGRAMELKSLDLSFLEESTLAKAQLESVAYFLEKNQVEGPLSPWGDQENTALAKIQQRELLVPSMVIPPAGKTDLFKY